MFGIVRIRGILQISCTNRDALRFCYDTGTIELRIFVVKMDSARIAQILSRIHYDLQESITNTTRMLGISYESWDLQFMGFPLNIGIKRPFNTCFGVYSWDSSQIRSRFVVKPWINESPNELTISTNAYESITIQLRCLRMHYEFATNQLRFLESGVRGQNF